jgi:penicillin-binding protein-related factor A (putative recombinase)
MASLTELQKSRSKIKLSEAEIEHKILVYLNISRIGFFWKNHTAGYYDGKRFRKQASPFAINGVPDIIGVIDGQFVAFEVKSDRGVQSDAQKAFMKRATSSGALVAVVRSLQEVLEALKAWGFSLKE